MLLLFWVLFRKLPANRFSYYNKLINKIWRPKEIFLIKLYSLQKILRLKLSIKFKLLKLQKLKLIRNNFKSSLITLKFFWENKSF